MSEPRELKHFENNKVSATLWKVDERFLAVFYDRCGRTRDAKWYDGDRDEVFYEFSQDAIDRGNCAGH